MAKQKEVGTIAAIAAVGVLGYLIFSRRTQTMTPGAAPALLPTGQTPASSLVSQAGNLFSSLKNIFSPGPTAAQTAAAANPSSIAPSDLPGAVTSPAASIAPDVIQALPSPLLDTTSPPADYIDTAALTDEASIAGVYDWPGPVKGVFSGRNQGMFPFTEINGTGLAVLGCAACAAALPKSGNAIGKFDWQSLIVPAAVVVGGYLLLKKTGLFSGPLTGTGQNNSQAAASTAAANQASLNSATNQGIPQTITTSQAASLANDIFTQGILSTPNLMQVKYDIIQANTLTDLLQIIAQFGTREVNTGNAFTLCALANINCSAVDMATFVRLIFQNDQTELKQINDYLGAQGINYQF